MTVVQMHPEEKLAIVAGNMPSRYQFARLATQVMIDRCEIMSVRWKGVWEARIEKYQEATDPVEILAQVTWMRHCVKQTYHEGAEERHLARVAEQEWKIIIDDLELEKPPWMDG